MKKVVVLSLGGSLIIPKDVDYKYLTNFKRIILKHVKDYKFIIVCGGGSIARKYISALKNTKVNTFFQSFAGISATRMNARFMSYFFALDPQEGIPHTIESIEKRLKTHNLIFCGALEYHPKQTSDSTATEIARYFKAIFINLTNVSGLYNKNPNKYKDARLIPEISWREFNKMANKIKFHPGQHFVLDQIASKIILKNKIPTYILGKDTRQLDALLNNKNFKGTEINR